MTSGGTPDDIVVRLCELQDIAVLHEINEAAVPGVGSVSRTAFDELVAQAAAVFVVGRRGTPGGLGRPFGFALCMTEGLAYSSLNYQWLAQRYDRFAYVDRVAVAPEGRGRGLGALLYDAVVAHFEGRRPVLLAEVNLAPPNPGSVRFHERHGFAPIGERWSDGRQKGVVYMARPFDHG
jgi:predicted GNAT superfamily acetyltransferase